MKTKKIIYITISIVIITTLLALVASNYTGRVISEETIKIGYIGPLSGNAASYGDPALKATQLAVDEINEKGINGKKIQLIVEDGGCDANMAVNAANKLINIDKVKIIVGGHCSTESLAIAPILNENKILQLATLTSSAKYTEAGDYSFRNWPTTDYFVKLLGELASEKSTNIAVLYEQKEFPQASAESFKRGFLTKDNKVIIEQSFNSEEKDFRTYLQKIKSSEADSIFFASQADDKAVIFFKTLKELDMIGKYKIYTSNEAISQKVYDATEGLIKNALTTNVYVNPKNTPTSMMLENYKQKYGSYPQTNYFYAASSYDSIYILRDAFQECDSEDIDCIKYFLYNLKEWNGASGRISFD